MRVLRRFLFPAMAVALLAACDVEGGNGRRGDIIWDIAPIEFVVSIHDLNGSDLLDSANNSNLISDITVEYDGKTYPVMSEREAYEQLHNGAAARTRYYMPRFYGLVLRTPYGQNHGYCLRFGEFDGAEIVMRREIVLKLKDGSQHTLAYSNNVKWMANGRPKISRQFYIDGHLMEDNGKDGVFHFTYSPVDGLRYATL